MTKVSNNVLAIVSLVTITIALVAFVGMLYNFQNSGPDELAHSHLAGSLVHTEPYDNDVNSQAHIHLNARLDDQRAEYTREIVAVKKDLQNAQIGTGDAQKDKLDEQRGSGTSPSLTIALASTEYLKGEIIFIEGTANPGQPITATICLPVQDFEICHKRTVHGQVDKRGTYTMGFATDFDDPLGIWNVYVKSDGQTSETLSFILK